MKMKVTVFIKLLLYGLLLLMSKNIADKYTTQFGIFFFVSIAIEVELIYRIERKYKIMELKDFSSMSFNNTSTSTEHSTGVVMYCSLLLTSISKEWKNIHRCDIDGCDRICSVITHVDMEDEDTRKKLIDMSERLVKGKAGCWIALTNSEPEDGATYKIVKSELYPQLNEMIKGVTKHGTKRL